MHINCGAAHCKQLGLIMINQLTVGLYQQYSDVLDSAATCLLTLDTLVTQMVINKFGNRLHYLPNNIKQTEDWICKVSFYFWTSFIHNIMQFSPVWRDNPTTVINNKKEMQNHLQHLLVPCAKTYFKSLITQGLQMSKIIWYSSE